MLIALIVMLTILFWGGMLFVYYKPELRRWFDNRYGPDSISKDDEYRMKDRQDRRRARWRWYG